MDYKFIQKTGALQEGRRDVSNNDSSHSSGGVHLDSRNIDPRLLELVPESVARENLVFPLDFDGETLRLATPNPSDIALADRLRFILAKNVHLIPFKASEVRAAIARHYRNAPQVVVGSLLREFTDADAVVENATMAPPPAARSRRRSAPAPWSRLEGRPNLVQHNLVQEPLSAGRNTGMFHFTVDEGQRVLMIKRNGEMTELIGPTRVWRLGRRFTPLKHFVAHPGEYLTIRFLDGRQEHVTGPADVWFDPRIHYFIDREDALKISAKEAVVVYSRDAKAGETARRIVYGPVLFVPEPGEWLHTFSWHASKEGPRGVEKVPNGLVFQKLWLMPDQMYHDVRDVRTADDAVLTIRLMIFFELVDIDRMLDATHDPIGDFVNAATADVVEFTGRHDFESFKRNTDRLNDLETYQQLCRRAAQCGYRINNVVYRGYGAPESLQQMHDQAIEARTRLQLERATEQQAQELENYRLESQLARASKRRSEQTQEVRHDLELRRERNEAELQERAARLTFQRQQAEEEARVQAEITARQNRQQQEHLQALRDLGVDLTAFLTQSRADRVIELRGNGSPHVHLDRLDDDGKEKQPH